MAEPFCPQILAPYLSRSGLFVSEPSYIRIYSDTLAMFVSANEAFPFMLFIYLFKILKDTLPN